MLPPPESPGQEKSTPHDPDIVRHYRLRIRCHASLRKEKHLLHIYSCFLLRNIRNRKNPCRTIPIQSRNTLHGITHIFSPKGKTPATHYSFMFSSLECMVVELRKTLRKRRDILLRRKPPYTTVQPAPQTGSLPKHRSTATPHVFSFVRKLHRRHPRIPFRTAHPVVRVTRLFEAHARKPGTELLDSFYQFG